MVSLRKQHEYLILALNRQLKVIMLKASQREMDGSLALNLPPPPTANSQDMVPMQRYVRRRHNSSSSSVVDPVNIQHRPSIVLHKNGQATVEAIGNETTTVTSPTSRSVSFSFPPASPIATTMLNNIYTVPIQEQEYVNALVVCPATQSKLFVGK
jgi:hypothetical protein